MQSEYIIEMLNIRKEFPGIVANDDITLQLRRGKKLYDERSLRWRFFRGPWRHIRRLRPYINRVRNLLKG